MTALLRLEGVGKSFGGLEVIAASTSPSVRANAWH